MSNCHPGNSDGNKMSPYRHFPIQSREGQRTGASEQISSRFPHHFHVRNQDHDQLRGLQWRRRRSSLIIRQARLLLFFSLLLSQFLDVIFLFSPDSLQTPTALLPQISPLLVQASPRYVSTTTACFIVSTKPTRANSNYRHPGQCRFSSKTQSKPTTIIPSTTTQSRTNVGISNRSDDAATAAAADENGAVVPPNGAKTVLPQAAGEAAIRTVQWLGERLTGSSLRTPPSRLSSFVRSNEANVALRYESNTRRRPQLFALADDGDSLDPDMMSSLISSSTPATSTISPTNQSKLLQKSTQSSNKSKNSNKNDRVQGIGGSLYRPDRDDQTVLPNETLQFASTKPPVGLRNLRQQFKNKSFKNYNKEQQQQQMEMEQLQVWEALSSLEKDST